MAPTEREFIRADGLRDEPHIADVVIEDSGSDLTRE